MAILDIEKQQYCAFVLGALYNGGIMKHINKPQRHVAQKLLKLFKILAALFVISALKPTQLV